LKEKKEKITEERERNVIGNDVTWWQYCVENNYGECVDAVSR
jgi:hypothetical protein